MMRCGSDRSFRRLGCTLSIKIAGVGVELLKAAHPPITRVGLLQNMGNPASPPQWEATHATAAALGLAAEMLDVRTEEDIAGAFAAIASLKMDALSVGIDALTQSKAETIVGLAAEHKLLTLIRPASSSRWAA